MVKNGDFACFLAGFGYNAYRTMESRLGGRELGVGNSGERQFNSGLVH